MATLADLLGLLHQQAWELAQEPVAAPESTLEQHLKGWVGVAASASRALAQLDLRRDLDEVLDQLAAGGLTSTAPANRRLADLGLTYGAIGDLLATEHTHIGVAAHSSRSRLNVNLQAGLHAAARATLSVAQAARAAEPAAVLGRLADITEIAALVPPAARQNLLDRLPITTSGHDTLKGSIDQWAAAAGEALNSHHQVSGYALQRVAGSIALLCQATAASTTEAARHELADPAAAAAASNALRRAGQAWREAAAWPPHLRLGGRNPALRRAAAGLDHALDVEQLAPANLAERLTSLWAGINTATLVGDQHRMATVELASSRALWVAVPALPAGYMDRHPGTRRSGWVRQPDRTAYGEPLKLTSRTATDALRQAAADLDAALAPPHRATAAPRPIDPPQTWERITGSSITRDKQLPIRADSPMLPGFSL